MKKKRRIFFGILLLSCTLLSGCYGQGAREAEIAPAEAEEALHSELPDGVYLADFDTDSSMFQVSEACDGKGTLTVENGRMTIHISLGSKKIIHLYLGLAADAEKEGAELLSPTVDTVTYSDGLTEEVYGFDVPVRALDEEFDLALIGTKGKWYDHKVSVSNPQPLDEDPAQAEGLDQKEDGRYTIDLTFEGGSGKAEILSPAAVTVSDGTATAAIQWNSPNYDYMIVDGEKYLPVNTEGNSVFEIPVSVFDEPMSVTGDTIAMSKPHEVEYTLTFHSDTMRPVEDHTEASEMTGRETGSDQAGNEKAWDDYGIGLAYEGSMELQYAENFTVDYYAGGYTMLTTTKDGAKFLIVPEGKEAPEGLDEDIQALYRPIKNLYLVASAVMDMFDAIDALDTIKFSGQKAEDWYIENAKAAMEDGDILYAGKYNKPDYELIVSGDCSLAIENGMIFHSPEVIEMLESFGIPVIIEYSSYESHPLGRVEWIKFFGALAGQEEKALKAFEEQAAVLEEITAGQETDNTDKTVAFFFITSNGLVQVRQSSDYIPKMIALAGGKYIFDNLGDLKSGRSTLNMQVEEFYDSAKDADFLIYNSSIDGGVTSIEELIDKCAVLEDFKAVQEGNVWCTTNDLYQQSMSIAYLIRDIHTMLQGEGEEGMKYLFRLE